MFVTAKGTGSSWTNCFDKSWRQYVVKTPGFPRCGSENDNVNVVEGRLEGRKEGRNLLGDLREEGDESDSKRRGLSKFRLNSPRINIRNGAPGCHKLACCSLLSFLDSTICTARGPFTVYRKCRLFDVPRVQFESLTLLDFKTLPARSKRHRQLCLDHT